MWRKNCGPHALTDLRRKLDEEKCIYIIFPEGSRSRDGQMARFKHGLGMLAAETLAPVVPCFIAGTFDALPGTQKNSPGRTSQNCDRGSALFCGRSEQSRRVVADRAEGGIFGARPGHSVLRGIALKLLRQVRRDVRDDERPVAFVFQLEHVTDSMNFGDQRRFICRNAEART